MREYSVPPAFTLGPDENLTDAVFAAAAQRPDRVSFSTKVDGAWVPVTAKEFANRVRELAAGLVARGIRPGDRVAILSRTRLEWTLADYAIWTAGGVTVPVYETSSADQVAWILGNSGAVAVFVETAAHAGVVGSIRDQLPELTGVFGFEDGAVANGGLDDLTAAGRDVPESDIEARRAGVGLDSLATIIYTSGTTGRPKGCELTHGALLFDVTAAVTDAREVLNGDASTLLFLPLAHVLARTIQCGAVVAGARLGYCSDTKELVGDLGTFRPTFVLSVPRVFEKIYNTAVQTAQAGGPAQARIFGFAEATAIAYSTALQNGRVPVLLKARHAVFERLVYAKVRAAMGGRVKFAVSGGAPLGARLGHFFRGIGVTVLEGYGLTETSAATTANTPSHVRIGTVGRPLSGTGIRIADDGEVLVSGPNVLRGYWQNPEATASEIEPGGWFHSGDIGELDGDGYLRITGRKKELIVTAGGKNVAPAPLEDRIRAHPLVSQVIVVGDQKPFIGALVTLDEEALPAWKAQHGKAPDLPTARLATDPQLRAEIQSAVDDANRTVSKAEQIRKFAVLPEDFTEATGEMTPTLKLKRNVVVTRRADELATLYS